MKTAKTKLLQVLDELIKLLNSDGQKHWVSLMTSIKNTLLKDESAGTRALLGAYGGMGSLNDLILGQRNSGKQINEQELNRKFMVLTSEAYDLATRLRSRK